MFSFHLYIKILLRVIVILVVCGLGVAGIVTGYAIILGIVAVCIGLGFIGSLVVFLNTTNRRIQLFLDAIEDNESMFFFPEECGSKEQRALYATFNRINRLITDNKQKEFERKLQQKEYESWDKLMHILTHEIMNSIAPIVSLSGTLLGYFQKKENPKKTEEITDVIVGKTIRGLETIKSQGENLMNFTHSYRYMASLRQPSPKLFSLTRLLQNLQVLYQTELDKRHIVFDIQLFQPEIEVLADEEQLSQVLVNLLKNAMQALENRKDGHISIYVSDPENTILIKIIDNGPGIANELMEDIFVPFFTTKSSGSGIGLSLSRQIIRMHNGQLLVSSEPFIQTCFTIVLPLLHR